MDSIAAPYGRCDFTKSCKQLTDKYLSQVLKTRVFASGCTSVRKYSILVKLTMYKYSSAITQTAYLCKKQNTSLHCRYDITTSTMKQYGIS